MIERFEKFSLGVAELSHYWHKLTSDEMEKHGLRGTHSVYLMALLHYPQGVTASRLVEICGKGKSDVSRMMSIMEDMGLTYREGVHLNNYRGVFKLTEKGKAIAEKVRIRAIAAVEYAGKDLNDNSRAIFYKAVESITDNLRFLAENGLPECKE